MARCHCQAAEIQFGECAAKKDLARYRRKGPDRTTRKLLEAVRSVDLTDVSLLDIGGGVGVIHHELLGNEVESAICVEASRAYVGEAEAETERRGQSEQVRFVMETS